MSDKRSAARFWGWFVANEARFFEVSGAEKEALLDELMEQLHAYHPDLFFQIAMPHDGPAQLIVTAEGQREAFGPLRTLVSAAPGLSGWTVTAFRPASGFDAVTEYEGARVDPRAAWFMPLEARALPGATQSALPGATQPGPLGLRVACADFVEELREEFLGAAQLVLENGLGELAAAEQIAFLDVERTPEAPSERGYLELGALPAYLDWRRTRSSS